MELGLDDEKEDVIVLRQFHTQPWPAGVWQPRPAANHGSEILHMIDNIDAEMMMMITALDKVAPGEMTNRIFAMDNRAFYKPNVDYRILGFFHASLSQKDGQSDQKYKVKFEDGRFGLLRVADLTAFEGKRSEFSDAETSSKKVVPFLNHLIFGQIHLTCTVS